MMLMKAKRAVYTISVTSSSLASNGLTTATLSFKLAVSYRGFITSSGGVVWSHKCVVWYGMVTHTADLVQDHPFDPKLDGFLLKMRCYPF